MNLEIAIAMCKAFEGLHRVGSDGLIYPYLCPAGIPTQGYGTVFRPDGKRVTMDDPPITEAVAEEWLLYELVKVAGSAVARLCPELWAEAQATGNWETFNSIVDFTYNLGAGRLQTSTLRRKLRAQDWDGAKEQLMLWTKGGGRVLPGLVKRRAAEVALLP